jgi:protease I
MSTTDLLDGKRVAFLLTDGVERVELTEPWRAIEEAGGRPELIALRGGEVRSFDHLEPSTSFPVDRAVSDASPDDYDALVLPGGVANPDRLRTDADAVAFVRDFFESGRPVAAICHAPWTLIEAGVVNGRTVTSWPSLRTDLENAGAHWVDEEVRVEDGLVTSRRPDDLPAFCAKVVEEIAEGVHSGQTA